MKTSYVVISKITLVPSYGTLEVGDILVYDPENDGKLTVLRNQAIVRTTNMKPVAVASWVTNGKVAKVEDDEAVAQTSQAEQASQPVKTTAPATTGTGVIDKFKQEAAKFVASVEADGKALITKGEAEVEKLETEAKSALGQLKDALDHAESKFTNLKQNLVTEGQEIVTDAKADVDATASAIKAAIKADIKKVISGLADAATASTETEGEKLKGEVEVAGLEAATVVADGVVDATKAVDKVAGAIVAAESTNKLGEVAEDVEDDVDEAESDVQGLVDVMAIDASAVKQKYLLDIASKMGVTGVSKSDSKAAILTAIQAKASTTSK